VRSGAIRVSDRCRARAGRVPFGGRWVVGRRPVAVAAVALQGNDFGLARAFGGRERPPRVSKPLRRRPSTLCQRSRDTLADGGMGAAGIRGQRAEGRGQEDGGARRHGEKRHARKRHGGKDGVDQRDRGEARSGGRAIGGLCRTFGTLRQEKGRGEMRGRDVCGRGTGGRQEVGGGVAAVVAAAEVGRDRCGVAGAARCGRAAGPGRGGSGGRVGRRGPDRVRRPERSAR
jgi:hypothetical protein